MQDNYGTDTEMTVSAADAPDTNKNEKNTDFPSFEELMKPKRTRKEIITRIVSLVLVLILLCGSVIYLWPYISNTAMYVFASPEGHQRYVYMKNAEDMTETVKKMLEDGRRFSDGSYNADIDIALTDFTKTLIPTLLTTTDSETGESTAILDAEMMELLGEIGIDIGYSAKDKMTALKLGIALKDASLGAELCLDREAGNATLDMPELFSQPLAVDLNNGELMAEDLDAVTGFLYDLGLFSEEPLPADPEALSMVSDALDYTETTLSLIPDEELTEHLIPLYTDTLFSQIENVERERTELTAGEVTQKVICFTSTLDQSALNNSTAALLTAMTDDEMTKAHVIEAIVKSIDEGNAPLLTSLLSDGDDTKEYDANGYYHLLCDKAQKLKEKIKENTDSGNELILKTYTDYKGDIIGIDISLSCKSEGKDMNVSLLTAKTRDGNKAGFEIRAVIENNNTDKGYTDISAVGSGIEKADLFDGEIDLVYTSGTRDKPTIREIATVVCEDVDLEMLKAGNMKGRFTVKSGSYFDDILGDLMGKAMSKCRIVIDADCTDNVHSLKLVVNLGDNELGTINISGAWQDADEITLHDNAQSDPAEWIESFEPSEELLLLIMGFISF